MWPGTSSTCTGCPSSEKRSPSTTPLVWKGIRSRSARAATTSAEGHCRSSTEGAADVVAVVVGLEHRHQLQPPLPQPGDGRGGHRRIHHRRLPAVMEHEQVVVVQHRQQLHLQPRCWGVFAVIRHRYSPGCCLVP